MNRTPVGLTRASIPLRKSLSKAMDCRVKPGNDNKNQSTYNQTENHHG